MNLEELKLVLDTIQSMGGDAKEFGIWWLVCSRLPAVLCFVFGVLTVFIVRTMVLWLIRAMNVSYRIADEVGELVVGGWNLSDEQRVISRVRALVEKERNAGGDK